MFCFNSGISFFITIQTVSSLTPEHWCIIGLNIYSSSTIERLLYTISTSGITVDVFPDTFK